MKFMIVKKYLIKIFNLKSIYRFLPETLVCLFFIYLFSVQAKDFEIKTSDHYGDTILFSGYQWVVKESLGKHTGPGNNFFSGSKDNVFVDKDGKLHLRVTHRDDNWYCPEVRMVRSLGIGKYSFYLDELPQHLDKDVVIGLFLYDREDTSNFHKEIDIEISQWGNDSSINSQYVIQPKEMNAHRFQSDMNLATKHTIQLHRKKIEFHSYYYTPNADDIPLEYSTTQVKPDYSYHSNSERISINVWLYHTSEPSNLKEFEVIISRFEFEQYWTDKLLKMIKKKKASIQ